MSIIYLESTINLLISSGEVEKITGLEWCSKTFDLFFKNMKNLKISAKELK